MFGAVGIDMVAGVSEILVIADATANPDWVAMDLFSQAEHDELAQAILLTPDAALLEAVAASAQRQIAAMPRRAIIAASLANRGALIRVRDLDEACAVANRVAPEHLELAVADPGALLPKIRHAGAIFMGHHASEALGDYCAGPEPRAADRPHGALLVAARRLRFPEAHERARRARRRRRTLLGPVAATLADGEGLPAHAQSARYRLRTAMNDWVPASRRGPARRGRRRRRRRPRRRSAR